MGETEQGPDQQSTDQPLSSVDFSALYKEQHQNAVDNDNGKAHFEAAAGDPKETDAVHFNAEAKADALAAQEPGTPAGESSEKLNTATNLLRGVDQAQYDAGVEEEAAGVRFDKAQEIIDQTKPRSQQ